MSMLWRYSPVYLLILCCITGPHNSAVRPIRVGLGLCDTDDTTMYRDTKSSRYYIVHASILLAKLFRQKVQVQYM